MNGKTKDSFPQTAPDISQLGRRINSPLFDQLRTVLEEGYRVSPRIEYSRCSMEPGDGTSNIKRADVLYAPSIQEPDFLPV